MMILLRGDILGQTTVIKDYSIKELSKHLPNIDFLNYKAMRERMAEVELSDIDYIVIEKVLENFITDGDVFKLYEDYREDEMKGRAFEVLYKIKNIKEG